MDTPDHTGIETLPSLPRRARVFVYAGLVIWLACAVYEVFARRTKPDISYIVFALVALSWTRYVLDAAERRRARVLTLLLLLIFVSFRIASHFVSVRPAWQWWGGAEHAWAAITNTLGVGVLCMWFGATGLTILSDSLGRAEQFERAALSRYGRPRTGYWLLVVYLIWLGQLCVNLYRLARREGT